MFIGHVEDQDEKIGWYSNSSWFLGQSYRDILKILDLFNNAHVILSVFDLPCSLNPKLLVGDNFIIIDSLHQ
jgi:hypothetical protein